MTNAIKVYKKTAPNGKVTAYLSRRDFVDHLTHTSPVDGVVVVDRDYLRGRRVFARVAVTYRYGRPQDEVMGLKFSKELELVNVEVAPNGILKELTDVQERLVKKLGGNAYAFSVEVPQNAPCSVTLEKGDDMESQPLGVTFNLKLYVAHQKEKIHKRNSVSFAVRKIQLTSLHSRIRQPKTVVSKGFTLSPGRLSLEVSLDKEVFCHGQAVTAHLLIRNASKKTVKSLTAQIVQHVEVTMLNRLLCCDVCSLETREGCPVTPGANLSKSFSLSLVPPAKKRFGVALDGRLKDEDANLASSTMAAAGRRISDALGFIVSYSFRVVLKCGAIGGELTADLPFQLVHPDPSTRRAPLRKTHSFEFEEFNRLRRSQSAGDE
ncbi:arrestin homolog isoform X1 [Procambarus clarkii]|uniref:arrestin homolog isoform X1 n=2 Tax=Procambarus clarkii TaxID=6728 RepID=UPI00374301E6